MGFEPTTTTLATWYSTTELHPRVAEATGADYGSSFWCVKRPALDGLQDSSVFAMEPHSSARPAEVAALANTWGETLEVAQRSDDCGNQKHERATMDL